MKPRHVRRSWSYLIVPALLVPLACSDVGAPPDRDPIGPATIAKGVEGGPVVDEIAVDRLSSSGRIAHLAQTGELQRMVARARRRNAEAGDRGLAATVAALGDDDEEEGEDDESPAPGNQGELSIAVDASGQHVVLGFNDARGFTTNPNVLSGVMVSDDGGQSFADVGPLPSPGNLAIGATLYPQIFGDPEVKYGGGANFVYASIMVTKRPGANGTVQTLCIHRSSDYGHTWQGPFEVTPASNPHGLLSGANARDAADKEFADIDPDTGRMMISWSNFTAAAFAPGGVEISTTYSDNVFTANPPTWSPRAIVAATSVDGQASVPRFAGNGSNDVYVAWRRGSSAFFGLGQTVGFARSINNGVSWSTPINASGPAFFTMDYVLGNDRVATSPAMDVDRSSGPRQGWIYLVYANNDRQDGADIAFQRSIDGGLTFSAPVLLNARPGGDGPQWFPWVSVDDATGRVDVFYYDQGAGVGDRTESTYLSSADGGASWSRPTSLSPRPFNAGWGNDTSQPNLGDYVQSVSRGGDLFAAWATTHPVDFDDGQPTSASFSVPDADFRRVAAGTRQASVRLGTVAFTDGNGTGAIDAGERVTLTLPLINYDVNPLHAGPVTGISATLATTTAGVTVTAASSGYPDLAAGATAGNATPFAIQLAPTFVRGTRIELTLAVTSAQGSITLHHRQLTGTPAPRVIFAESFDGNSPGTLPAGWATAHGGGANTVPWTTRNDRLGATSNGLWHQNANDGVGGTGNPTRFERVFSPIFNVPAGSEAVVVEFDAAYDTEDDLYNRGTDANPVLFNVLAYDGFTVRITDQTSGHIVRSVFPEAFAEEIRTGSSWFHPKHAPRNSSTSYFQDISMWAGDSAGFRHVRMVLPFGGRATAIQLRFEYTQDSGGTCADVHPGHGSCGVMVDNIVATAVTSQLADLSIVHTAAPDPVTTGGAIGYHLVATNAATSASTAQNVTIVDDLPVGISPTGCSAAGGSCAIAGQRITATYPSLAPGAAAGLDVAGLASCALANGTSLTASATVSSTTPDNDGSNDTATATVTAANPPPTIAELAPSQSQLWPPKHNLVDIKVTYTEADNCGAPMCVLSATSNEPDNGLGDGDTGNDIQVVSNRLVRLRAERGGAGTGRVYTLTVRCTDSGGATTSSSTTVIVPHDLGN